eukprot:scaffold5034_cov385-Prasinococcus_capsulatus_cf.AAC.6
MTTPSALDKAAVWARDPQTSLCRTYLRLAPHGHASLRPGRLSSPQHYSPRNGPELARSVARDAGLAPQYYRPEPDFTVHTDC